MEIEEPINMNLNETQRVQSGFETTYKFLNDPQPPKLIKYYWNPDKNGEDFLGGGQYGNVFKAYKMMSDNVMNKKGRAFALKHIDLSFLKKNSKEMKAYQKSIQNETNFFKKIGKLISYHPNLITIYDIFQTANSVYILMDLCEKECSLFDYLLEKQKKQVLLSENEIMSIIDNILQGLLKLNEAKMMHRDIKLDNIIKISKNSTEWKLCDYGFSRSAEQLNANSKRDFTKLGTPFYQSPQILKNQKYGFKCDIYSVGVVLFNLLFHKYPFTANSPTELIQKSFQGLPTPLGENREISKHMETLLRKLLAVEEDNRPGLICDGLLETNVFNLPEYQQLKDQFLAVQHEKKEFYEQAYIEIQKCIHTFSAARELFLKFKFIKIDYWIKYILLYSLAKCSFKRYEYLNTMYEQELNIYKFQQDIWLNILQSHEFQVQRNIMRKLKIDIDQFEKDENIHRTKMESLQNKFDDPTLSILKFLEDYKCNLQTYLISYKIVFIHILQSKFLNNDEFLKSVQNQDELIPLIRICHTQFCREIIQEEKNSCSDVKFFEEFYRKLANKTFEENLEMFKELRKMFLKIPDQINILKSKLRQH